MDAFTEKSKENKNMAKLNYKVKLSVFAYVHRHDTLPVLEATLESQMSVHLSVSH